MFSSLARFLHKHRWPVVLGYALLFVLAAAGGRDTPKRLRAGGFEDPLAMSAQVKTLLADRFGIGQADVMAIYTVEQGTIDDVEMLARVVKVEERVRQSPAVLRVVSHYSTGAPELVSQDRKRTMIVAALRGDDQEKSEALARMRDSLAIEGASLQIGGYTAVNDAVTTTLEQDLQRAELIAFPITALLLIVVFGGLVSAALPLVLGALAVVLAFAIVRVVTMFTGVSVFAANIITILGLGLAIDYSLFLLDRFREELRTSSVETALQTTMATTGRAVVFSGVTVGASLISLFVFPQMFLRSMGIGGIAVVVAAVLIAATLLPALFAILGPKVDALRLPIGVHDRGKPFSIDADGAHGFWPRLAFAVMKRPILTALAVVGGLLWVGAPFLRFDPSLPNYRVLPEGNEAREAMVSLEDAFLPNQVTPHDVVVTVHGDVLSQENLARMYELHAQFRAMPGITRVLSVFTPGEGQPTARVVEAVQSAATDEGARELVGAFAVGNQMRFSLVSEWGFNDDRCLDQARALRALAAPPGTSIVVGGSPAVLVDLKECLRTRAPLMIVVVVIAMFAVLFAMFGSITLPLKAIVMNSLSLTASFGTIVWVFQDGRFEDLLHYRSMHVTESTQPVLMFAVLFGLSMDYEVLLLARVREEYVRTGDNARSVATGLARTGRLITSAAALLVVVFCAFATSQIVFMKTLGLGMALAIALDATVVRALLVPAAMQLMGRWNWYAPPALRRLWDKIGVEH